MPTYYVDNVNGSAGNPGTSELAPKDIPQNLTLADGDTVIIKGTNVPYAITGAFGWNLVARSNLTIQRWDGFQKPVLTSAASNNDITSSRLIGAPIGTSRIAGLIFQSAFRGAIVSSSASTGAALTVEDCEGYDIGVGLWGADQTDGNSLGAGFLILTQSGGNRYANVTVRRNKVLRAGRSICHINADTLVLAENNEFRFPSQIPTVAGDTNHGDCIIVPVACTRIEILRNKLDHSNKDSKHCFNQSTSTSGTILVDDNDMFGPLGTAVTQCKMVYTDAPAVITRNRIYTGGMAVDAGVGSALRHNGITVSGSGRGGTSAGDLERGIVALRGASSAAENNTVAFEPGVTVIAGISYSEGTPSSGQLRNNAIVALNGATIRAGIKRSTSGVTENYNFLPASATNAVVDESALPLTQGANSSTADPMVSSDARPRIGSPLLTGGFDLGYLRDIRQHQAKRYIGAYAAAALRDR